MIEPILELSGVSKDYRGLRPLRIERLSVAPGDRIAIIGLDRPAAEVFVNLVTGASLPDQGDVRLFGRTTASIADAAEWLTVVDRFGIVSDRAVLLDALTVVQNLSMPFTLEIEPPPAGIRDRAAALAREVGLSQPALEQRVGDLEPTVRLLVRLGRALALDPAILLIEHATASVPRSDARALGERMRTIAERRRVALIAVTADQEFADLAATRVLTLKPATGRLTEPPKGWFRRR